MEKITSRMKILLVAVPSKRIPLNISGVYAMPPLGLAYIAAVLKKCGFLVDILDMPALRLKVEDINLYFNKGEYALCGISCNIFNLNDGIKIASLIKKIDPRLVTIIGGRCTAFSSELIFKYSAGIDIIVRGAGEMSMLNLAKSIGAGKDYRNIPGISYMYNGQLVENDNEKSKVELDSLPFPARELLPNKRYRIHPPFNIRSPITIVETSRGCPFNCIFCSLHEGFSERSVESVLEELKEIAKKYGVKEVYFCDANLTFNKKRLIELCDKMIENNIKLVWSCKSRVDLVDQELLHMMRRAGCYMISYGVESGSQEILDSLNKRISTEDTNRAFFLTRKEGIRSLAYVLIASPGENEKSLKKTDSFVRKINPDFVLYGELLPDPSSLLMQRDIKEKRITAQEVFDFYVFNKDIFSHTNLYGISRKDIKRWLYTSNTSFYLRPSYLIGRLRDIRNSRDFLNMAQGANFILKDKLNIGKEAFFSDTYL